MGSFITKVRNFMYGRNGIDKLTYGLLVIYCIIAVVKIFFRGITAAWIIISVIQYLFLAFIIYRIFSKNLQKRYNENFKFEQFFKAWKPYLEHMKLRITFFKTHRFRTCKSCDEFLRLKKGRGKRTVTCPKCGKELRFHFMF